MKTTQKEAMEAFDRWWFNEGSGMPPLKEEDHAEHVRRMCAIAWSNGAYCAGAVD